MIMKITKNNYLKQDTLFGIRDIQGIPDLLQVFPKRIIHFRAGRIDLDILIGKILKLWF